MPPPASSLYFTSAMSGSIPVVSQSIRKLIARVVIAGERSQRLRHARALFVSFTGHDAGDGATQRPAFHAVVTVAVTHDERAEIRITQPQRAENMRVLRDVFDRVACVIDDDL